MISVALRIDGEIKETEPYARPKEWILEGKGETSVSSTHKDIRSARSMYQVHEIIGLSIEHLQSNES